MEVVTGATSSLLPKLGALLQDEFKLQDKVKKDIESLQNELVFMNATLRMVAEVPRDQLDEHVRIWAVFIRELSYDMEDVVNIFVARVHSAPHLDGLITKFFKMLCMGRTHHQIAGMVEEIRTLIKEVADLRDRYQFDNIVTRAATQVVLPQRENMLTRYLAADCEEITRRHISIKYEEPVAVEEDMKVLHNWITSSDSQGRLSIFGPAGVGKTTIAMALYRKYRDRFQCQAMVKVSPSCDITSILMDILSQLAQIKWLKLQGHNGDIFGEIEAELRECLQGKRFLLLIDDVCSTKTVEVILKSLPHSEEGSRVIVTTRFNFVARGYNMKTGDCIHEVGLLSEQNAKQLFMEEMGKECQRVIPSSLWEICGGLPLAIVTMAGQFACNPDKSDEEWGEVCAALAPSPSTSHNGYQLMKILSTCYNDMPVEIKTCALYLSMFPMGQKISRKRLTRRWISGGCVIEQQGLSAEEVAETYLNHLTRRKFLLATERSSNGKVKSYQVHAIVLEYIVCKANEENFVTAIGDWIVSPPSNKIRRLSIKYSGSSYGKEIKVMNLSRVRDLTMLGSLNQLPSSSLKFGQVVQLLDLEGCKDFKQHHTKEICRMFLLKYLSLRRTDIKKLTKKIGDLLLLETLDIRETDITELPTAICKLDRLVHLFGGNKRTRKALKLPKELKRWRSLKALRVLTGIEISEETTADLHHLINLRKLAIYKLDIIKGDMHFIELSSSIEYLGGYCSLSALVIHDESAEFLKSLGYLSTPPKFLTALELTGKLLELPKWIAELHTLTKLTLSVMVLRADNLELLSNICSLFSLTFSINATNQDEETAAINKALPDGVILFPVGGFENLKLLRFFAPYVPQLSFPDGAMPTLERLDLQFSNFEGLVGIKGLKNLQQLHIGVHDEASQATKSLVEEMVAAAREDREGPRIIFD